MAWSASALDRTVCDRAIELDLKLRDALELHVEPFVDAFEHGFNLSQAVGRLRRPIAAGERVHARRTVRPRGKNGGPSHVATVSWPTERPLFKMRHLDSVSAGNNRRF